MIKRKIYIILLLLLIIFVSLSFYYILNFCAFGICTIKEGLCLPSCDKVEISKTTTKIPDCAPLKLQLLQPNDASKIYSKCINPFIEKINNEMKENYNYDIISKLKDVDIKQTGGSKTGVSVFGGPNAVDLALIEEQKKMKSYFDEFSYNITLQDKMDNLITKLPEIQNNSIFKNHSEKDKILTSLQKYKEDRTSKFSEIYNQFINDIEPYGENILIENECMNDSNQNFYKDENFNQLIKEQKENPVYYGQKSSFHKIYDYLKEAKEGKLGTV
jgi:hypothetical protein